MRCISTMEGLKGAEMALQTSFNQVVEKNNAETDITLGIPDYFYFTFPSIKSWYLWT